MSPTLYRCHYNYTREIGACCVAAALYKLELVWILGGMKGATLKVHLSDWAMSWSAQALPKPPKSTEQCLVLVRLSLPNVCAALDARSRARTAR